MCTRPRVATCSPKLLSHGKRYAVLAASGRTHSNLRRSPACFSKSARRSMFGAKCCVQPGVLIDMKTVPQPILRSSTPAHTERTIAVQEIGQMAKTLVVGSSGTVGSELVKLLTRKGHDVLG